MNAIRITVGLLLGAGVTASCNDRSTPTSAIAPTPVAALTTTDVIGDRPYTWSFACNAPDSYTGSIYAEWWWTENGVELAGYGGSAHCYANWIDNVGGPGVRPANANGFSACVGREYVGHCPSPTTWTFDPSGSFKASLKGTLSYCVSDCIGGYYPKGPNKPKLVTVTGILKVES